MTTKIVGTIFGTILAPVLATFIVKWLEKGVTPPATPPQANVAQADPTASTSPQTSAAKTPDSRASVAEVPLEAERAPTESPSPAIAPFDAKQARAHQEAWARFLGTQVETTNSIGMKLVLIPPGEFLMGSSDEQVEAAVSTSIQRDERKGQQDRIRRAERPQHQVVLTRPLWMSATEVTIGQFREFVEATNYVTLADTLGGDSPTTDAKAPGTMGRTWRSPSFPVADDSPATQIAWTDAVAFCNWLCRRENLPPSYREDAQTGWVLLPGAAGYRLPSEAEWEFACRAGTTTQFSFGDDPDELNVYGWSKANSQNSARPVGRKSANSFGLYDMHGNVAEWCGDWMDDKWYAVSPKNDPQGPPAGNIHAVRGGSWYDWASSSRSTFRRLVFVPLYRGNTVGIRVVRGG
jgi:formylglycine-generating enzyme required for sulfatase activity